MKYYCFKCGEELTPENNGMLINGGEFAQCDDCHEIEFGYYIWPMLTLFKKRKIRDMRALSWKQPFASLMLHGKIETRTWKTDYRGLVLICASKKSYSLKEILSICGDYQYHRIVDTLGYETSQFDDVCGYAITVGDLVDCRKMTKEDENKCFVNYNPDLWCHIYQNVKPITPIPFKGKQGWSTVDENIFKQIKYESINDLINQLKK